MKTKSFNSSYNSSYNWIKKLLTNLDRKKAYISVNREHIMHRRELRVLNLEKLFETVRNGKVIQKKCSYPNRICFFHYFGKTNDTYYAIAEFKKEIIEVVTGWKRKGR